MTPNTRTSGAKQPTASAKAASSAGAPVPAHLTTDDLRHKALAVRDVTTGEARRLLERNRVRLILAGAIVVAVGFSVAYYAGARAAARAHARTRR